MKKDMTAAKAMVAELKVLGATCRADVVHGGLQVIFGCRDWLGIKSDEALAKALADVRAILAPAPRLFGEYEVRIAK
jgi:hypothetical protein